MEGAEQEQVIPYGNKPRLVKLVRDLIPDFLAGRNAHVVYKPIEDPEEIRKELRKKLVEEALEYMSDPSVDELADVLETLYGLAGLDLGVEWIVVQRRAFEKAGERGGFEIGMGMYVTSEPPND